MRAGQRMSEARIVGRAALCSDRRVLRDLDRRVWKILFGLFVGGAGLEATDER